MLYVRHCSKVTARLLHITKTRIHPLILELGLCNKTKWTHVNAGRQSMVQHHWSNSPTAPQEGDAPSAVTLIRDFSFYHRHDLKAFLCHLWHWDVECSRTASFNGSSQATCQDSANRQIYGLSGTNRHDLWSRGGCGSFLSFSLSPSKPSKAHINVAQQCNLPRTGKQYSQSKLLE